jgi:transitional endoplasmic reticulum ATPase
MQGTYRALLYFIALPPVLHWFNSVNEFLFHEDAVSGMVLSRDTASPLELVYGLIFAIVAVGGLVFVIRHRPRGNASRATVGGASNRQDTAPRWSNVPNRTFADVGGMDDQKRRISAVVQNRLHPEKFKGHGVVQNGILLYGPRGTGKTFLAEATAGEFHINYWYAKPTSMLETRVGNSEANIREAFARAYAHRPVLFFLDEIDSIGTQRQQLGRNDDTGGGARLYNSVVTELMQCIDQYRGATGFILVAATNFYEGLDEALVRDMRFDEKIRVDLPDEAARTRILTAQLSQRLWTPFPVEPFASRTPGWSAAKLTGLVNKAASIAALENRRIEQRDLQRAFDESGGADRPLLKPVDWRDLVLPAAVERDLRNLIRLMDAGQAEKLKVPVPTGLLLVGPAGTGKTSIAHLIATQTRRSFYAIAPADVPTAERLAQVFARAREHSPSILFIDEMDGFLPRGDNGYYMGQHHIQLVEQALMLMSQLDPGNQVFLVGTTNHIDNIDPRVLRGGRFTEKIEVGLPDDQGYLRLIEKYLGPIQLGDGFTCDELLNRLRGISPADLQGLVNTAKRMAMNRMKTSDEALPPLIWEDFELALERTRSRI